MPEKRVVKICIIIICKYIFYNESHGDNVLRPKKHVRKNRAWAMSLDASLNPNKKCNPIPSHLVNRDRPSHESGP